MACTVSKDTPLKPYTWFQVGGKAKAFAKVRSLNDLSDVLQVAKSYDHLLVLGAGSNLLISDNGINAFVIKLIGDFTKISICDKNILTAGAGALDRTVADTALNHGLSGLEFLSTIPGSIGGAIAMNAGCYGSEIKDILHSIDGIFHDGKEVTIFAEDLIFKYRKTILPKNFIVTKATFQLHTRPSAEILKTMQEYKHARNISQPTKGRTGGSTFKNPRDIAAWKLIDQADCRGLTIGKAQIAEKHCNFMLNLGGASAKDLFTLGETVRQKVLEKTNINLEWEIICLGDF